MKIHAIRSFLALAVVCGLTTPGFAQVAAQYQGQPRPLGLSPIGPTYKANSDPNDKLFTGNTLQTFTNFVQTMLPEGVAFTGANLNQLDPTRLYFTSDYAPRVYFLGEGAGYNNALCVTIAQAALPTDKPVTGNNYLVFPLAQSPLGSVHSTPNALSYSQPLMPGDFVNLGTVKAGSQLAFFLAAEMSGTTSSATPKYVYYNGEATNPDDYQHMIAFFPDNSQFIIIGFEDMNNVTEPSDHDCNDVLFAVDVGPQNSQILRNVNSLPK